MYTEKIGKFVFSNDIPPELDSEIRKYLLPMEWLLPPWCQRCNVGYGEYNADNVDAAICANVSYRYRTMTLTFFLGWLESDSNRRLDMVVHDLIHSSTCILADYVRDEIKRLLPKDEAPKYHSAILNELEERHESMTQDLAHVITQRLLATEYSQENTE